MGIFLADEGLDVGVEDLGVVAVDLEAPAGGRTEVCVTPGGKGALGPGGRGAFTCGGRAGGVVGLLWQVEDLLAGIGRRDGVLALPGRHWVVLFTIVVGVEELLEPLDEIQVVLESAFDQFLYRNDLKSGNEKKRKSPKPQTERNREGETVHRADLVHVHPFEGGLEQLEVVKVLVLQLGLELDLFKTDAAGEEKVHELAVGSSCRGPEPDATGEQPPKQRRENRNTTFISSQRMRTCASMHACVCVCVLVGRVIEIGLLGCMRLHVYL